MARLGTRGLFSTFELPRQEAIKTRCLPLYGLHELFYGLPEVAGEARVAGRGQDGLVALEGERHSW